MEQLQSRHLREMEILMDDKEKAERERDNALKDKIEAEMERDKAVKDTGGKGKRQRSNRE